MLNENSPRGAKICKDAIDYISSQFEFEFPVRKCYWIGIIGETEHWKLPSGADSPMRKAIKKAFKEITGHDDEILYSGWSADADAVERILKAWN